MTLPAPYYDHAAIIVYASVSVRNPSVTLKTF